MVAKTRKSLAVHNSTPVDLVLLQIILKVYLQVFFTALNISMCTNLLIFVTSRTRIIMIMVSC